MISRLGLARDICCNMVVLDIGGRKMPGCDEKYPKFAKAYQEIRNRSKEYRIVDVQNDPEVDYSMDLNTRTGVDRLAEALEEYKPDVMLCMETLEHVNYHYEIMNAFASAIEKHEATCLITLPNNSNWIVNHIIGIDDHSIAFFKDVSQRFVQRSDLGKHQVIMFPCTGMYLWYWPIAYVLSGFQPTSWGFLIGPKHGNPVFTKLAAQIQHGCGKLVGSQ